MTISILLSFITTIVCVRFFPDIVLCFFVVIFLEYLRVFVHEYGHFCALKKIKAKLHGEYNEQLDIHLQVSFRYGFISSTLLYYLSYAEKKYKEYQSGQAQTVETPYPEQTKIDKPKLFENGIFTYYSGSGIFYYDPKLSFPSSNPDPESSKYEDLIKFSMISGFKLEMIVGTIILVILLLSTVVLFVISPSFLYSQLVYIIMLYLNIILWLAETFDSFNKGTDKKYYNEPWKYELKPETKQKKLKPPFKDISDIIILFGMTFLPALLNYAFKLFIN